MGLLEIIGIGKQAGDAIAQPIDAIGNAFDRLLTSTEEKMAAKAVLEKLRQHPMELQTEINKLEAQSRSLFVAGWRPFIGWICGTALGIYYIPQFAVATILWVRLCWNAQTLASYPISDISGLTQLIIAMLGLAGYRTLEKFGGKTK